MERDLIKNRQGYSGDYEEPTLSKSSSIRAKSTAINRRLNEESYPSIKQDEFNTVIFDQPTSRTSRQRRSVEPMIDEYYRRNRQLPTTQDDHRIQRPAPRTPRYPQPVQEPQQPKVSKRAFFALLGTGVAVLAGGAAIAKNNADQAHIQQRELLGQYGFTPDAVPYHGKTMRVYAWIESDYIVRFAQENADGKSPDIQKVPIAAKYQGPLDQVNFSFQPQGKEIILTISAGALNLMVPFTDNGSFYIEGGL